MSESEGTLVGILIHMK